MAALVTAVAAAGVGLAAEPPPVAAAGGCIRIVAGAFSPSGDESVMPGLNNEWVAVRSVCTVTRVMTGWTMHDYGAENHFSFPDGFSIPPRTTVRIRSGTGTNSSSTLYWGRTTGEVWGNAAPERAYLLNSSGRVYADWSPYTDRTLVGAGDIADCGSAKDAETATLLDSIPGTVFTAGDNAYEYGTAQNFADCYEPTWGRHRARTRPAAGNHEYYTSGAAGHFGYFGAAAGPAGKGYYSYERGAWHVVVLNSNCSYVGGCHAGSPQEQWLRADLKAHPAECTLAIWHHPRFSSGTHGNNTSVQPFWQALYDHRAEVIIVGHDHDYERFAPQTPFGASDPTRGIRQFVVGTGGRGMYGFGTIRANSEVRNNSSRGVLRLDLSSRSYSWSFVPIPGATFTDSGTASCR